MFFDVTVIKALPRPAVVYTACDQGWLRLLRLQKMGRVTSVKSLQTPRLSFLLETLRPLEWTPSQLIQESR